ncbi:MAG: hypothetical protein K8J31_06700 [Anaerolineae bacterium]|nr:hypothetical protein [Anaerolineae bacterium]
MQQLLSTDQIITYDYDPVQDMLYILFEPVTGATFYDDVPDMPGIMRRYSMGDERMVGITVHDVKGRLSADILQNKAIRQLVQTLVEQLG